MRGKRDKRRWTDPEILVPILVAVISSILAPIILNQMSHTTEKQTHTAINSTESKGTFNRSQSNLSSFLQPWYYTSFYNTAKRPPIQEVDLSQSSNNGPIKIDFLGQGLSQTVQGKYSGSTISGNFSIPHNNAFYFTLALTPTNKLHVLAYTQNRTNLAFEEYLISNR